ncbi:MAG: recombinase family protein [Pseudomonadota bacterium]
MARVALYLRVSTVGKGQTTDNQEIALREWAERGGHEIVATYSDNGISGAKGREKRPGLDSMMKAATRREFDMIAAWDLSRLGRSLTHVVYLLAELRDLGIDLYLDRQAIDTSNAMGKAMLGMAAVFAELERDMIADRVKAGLERAKRKGKRLGRPRVSRAKEIEVERCLREGKKILTTAKACGVSETVVRRIKRERFSEAA